MLSDKNRAYYMLRSAQERKAAGVANRNARPIHLELAERYDALANVAPAARIEAKPADHRDDRAPTVGSARWWRARSRAIAGVQAPAGTRPSNRSAI